MEEEEEEEEAFIVCLSGAGNNFSILFVRVVGDRQENEEKTQRPDGLRVKQTQILPSLSSKSRYRSAFLADAIFEPIRKSCTGFPSPRQ